MKSSLSSSLLEGSLGLGLWLLLTPLAQLLKLLKLLTAAPSLLVPGQRLSSSSFLLEISFLPGSRGSRGLALISLVGWHDEVRFASVGKN